MPNTNDTTTDVNLDAFFSEISEAAANRDAAIAQAEAEHRAVLDAVEAKSNALYSKINELDKYRAAANSRHSLAVAKARNAYTQAVENVDD